MSVQYTQLSESINSQSKGANGTNYLMNKWRKELNLINEAFNGKASQEKLLGTAVLLENTERALRNVQAHRNIGFGAPINEATQPSDVSYFRKFAFNNLMAVYPNLIAPELVSSQPMLARSGEIRYMRVVYGSDKGSIKKGDTMFGQYNLGDHPADFSYSSDGIDAEFLGSDGSEVNFNFSWTPVTPGTVKINTAEGVVMYRDDSLGHIINASGASAGTINYETGAIVFDAAPVEGLVAEYEYDNMTVPVQAPEIQVKIIASPIFAKSRKLKALYSFDANLDMLNDYGIALSGEVLSMSAAQLKREIDDEIINDLATRGTAPGVTWDATIPEGISLVDHYAGFPAAVTAASNNIWNLTQVANASWIIVGQDAANIVEAIPRFKSSGVINPKGAHLAGWLGNLPVYKSANLKSDDWVVGYKGDSLFEAGYVYAPYLPIMSTQLLTDETFTNRQGFTTSYGKKMTNSDFYARCKITRS